MRCTVLTMCAAVLLSCAACTPTLPEGKNDPVANHPQIVPQEGLKHGLLFGSPIVTGSTDASPMHVEVPVRTSENKPLHVQYRFEFSDKDGRQLSSTDAWRFITLEPETLERLKGNASETDATEWRLVLRPSR